MKLTDEFELDTADNCWVLKHHGNPVGYFGTKRGLQIALKERKVKIDLKNFPDYHESLQ